MFRESLGKMNTSKVQHAHELCNSGNFQEALEHFKELAAQSADPLERAGYLIDQATCHSKAGHFTEARACVAEAKKLAVVDTMARVQIDIFSATLLIEEGARERGLDALSQILKNYASWLEGGEGRELYQDIEMQRGFTLMHLSRCAEARSILEEVVSFNLGREERSRVHCHLGRCYVELSEYRLAKDQFLLAQHLRSYSRLGIRFPLLFWLCAFWNEGVQPG